MCSSPLNMMDQSKGPRLYRGDHCRRNPLATTYTHFNCKSSNCLRTRPVASPAQTSVQCRLVTKCPSSNLTTKRTTSRVQLLFFYLSALSSLTSLVIAIESGIHSNHHNGPRPPRIKEHPSSAVVKKHEPVTLSCKADGEPEPVIEWYRDNELVRKSSNHIYLNNGDLFILKVMNHKKEKDTGVYFCLARNVHGKARSHNATIEIASIRDVFRTLPKNVFAAVGDVAVLECSPPRGYPEPEVQWKKDGDIVVLNNRFRLSDGNLFVSDVQPEDAGKYQCLAQNMGGSRESPPAQLIVRVKPYFIRKPEDVTALSNEAAEINCKVGGDPAPKVTWRREGGIMPSSRTIISDDKSIKISHVTEEDEGLYTCEAENLVGKISSSATLIVHSRPNFVVEPKDVYANINGAARFDCVASGNPRPSVFWTKEGNQFLMFPDNKYGRFSVTSDGSLLVSPVKKEDKGYYVCSALSVVGSSTAKAHLNISSMADIPPPIVILGPADQTLPEHTTAILPCDVTGTPHPTLKWLLNNIPIPVNNARFTVLESGTLQIDDLQLSDSGEYKCLVYSENGESNWSAFLKVVAPHSTNTMFHRMPDPSTYPDAPSRPVIVNVTENSVTISWMRIGRDGSSPFKGVMIEYFSPDHHNKWILAAKNVLSDMYTVKDLKSGSRYFFLVRAQNNHGVGPPSPISYEARTLGTVTLNNLSARTVDAIEIRRKLESVTVQLRDARALSSSVVKLFWDIKGSQEFVEGFHVRYRVIDPNNLADENFAEHKYNMVTVYNGGASTYVLNNLPKFTTFEFFLVPFYKSIDGKPSNIRVVKTLEDVPTAPPTMIKARPISSNSAVVTWKPPPSDKINGLLIGYNIYIHGSYITYNINLTVDSNTTSYLLRNLTSETEYIIQITAFTSAGPGTPSPSLTFIMDPLLSTDVYSEKNSNLFDSSYMSNVWICVLIISLIILTLIVLLLGFLLFKKRTSILKKNNESLTINSELKSRNGAFYCRQFEYQKSWNNDTQSQNDLKPIGTNSLIKMSPSLHQSDNNGYSVVTSDEQAADYAEVSQTENNYETAYYATSNPISADAPVAYASSSIIPANQQFKTNTQTMTPNWGTQINLKNSTMLKPNFATLDRNTFTNPYFENRYKKTLDSSDMNRVYGKKTLGLSVCKQQTQPLIGSNLNEYEDASLFYADSVAYGGNVTQIPSSKLMANQLKYGSLSRISNNKTKTQFPNNIGPKEVKKSLILNDNYKRKPNGSYEWESNSQGSHESSFGLISQIELSSPKDTLVRNQGRSQLDMESTSYKPYGRSRHIIANPLDENEAYSGSYANKLSQMTSSSGTNSSGYTLYGDNDKSISSQRKERPNTVLSSCDNESGYQELP